MKNNKLKMLDNTITVLNHMSTFSIENKTIHRYHTSNRSISITFLPITCANVHPFVCKIQTVRLKNRVRCLHNGAAEPFAEQPA